MSNKIPDAWDDDWVNVADVRPPKCCRALRVSWMKIADRQIYRVRRRKPLSRHPNYPNPSGVSSTMSSKSNYGTLPKTQVGTISSSRAVWCR